MRTHVKISKKNKKNNNETDKVEDEQVEKSEINFVLLHT